MANKGEVPKVVRAAALAAGLTFAGLHAEGKPPAVRPEVREKAPDAQIPKLLKEYEERAEVLRDILCDLAKQEPYLKDANLTSEELAHLTEKREELIGMMTSIVFLITATDLQVEQLSRDKDPKKTDYKGKEILDAMRGLNKEDEDGSPALVTRPLLTDEEREKLEADAGSLENVVDNLNKRIRTLDKIRRQLSSESLALIKSKHPLEEGQSPMTAPKQLEYRRAEIENARMTVSHLLDTYRSLLGNLKLASR